MTTTHPIPRNSKISLVNLMVDGELIENFVKPGNYGTIVRNRSAENTYHVMLSDGSGIVEITVPESNWIR